MNVEIVRKKESPISKGLSPVGGRYISVPQAMLERHNITSYHIEIGGGALDVEHKLSKAISSWRGTKIGEIVFGSIANNLFDACVILRELFTLDKEKITFSNFEPGGVKIIFESFAYFYEDILNETRERLYPKPEKNFSDIKNLSDLEYVQETCRYLMTLYDAINTIQRKYTSIGFAFDIEEWKQEIIDELNHFQLSYANCFLEINIRNMNTRIEFLENQTDFLVGVIEFNINYETLKNKELETLGHLAIYKLEKLINMRNTQITDINKRSRISEQDKEKREFYKTDIQTAYNKILYISKLTNNDFFAKQTLSTYRYLINESLANNYMESRLKEKGFKK